MAEERLEHTLAAKQGTNGRQGGMLQRSRLAVMNAKNSNNLCGAPLRKHVASVGLLPIAYFYFAAIFTIKYLQYYNIYNISVTCTFSIVHLFSPEWLEKKLS